MDCLQEQEGVTQIHQKVFMWDRNYKLKQELLTVSADLGRPVHLQLFLLLWWWSGVWEWGRAYICTALHLLILQEAGACFHCNNILVLST